MVASPLRSYIEDERVHRSLEFYTRLVSFLKEAGVVNPVSLHEFTQQVIRLSRASPGGEHSMIEGLFEQGSHPLYALMKLLCGEVPLQLNMGRFHLQHHMAAWAKPLARAIMACDEKAKTVFNQSYPRELSGGGVQYELQSHVWLELAKALDGLLDVVCYVEKQAKMWLHAPMWEHGAEGLWDPLAVFPEFTSLDSACTWHHGESMWFTLLAAQLRGLERVLGWLPHQALIEDKERLRCIADQWSQWAEFHSPLQGGLLERKQGYIHRMLAEYQGFWESAPEGWFDYGVQPIPEARGQAWSVDLQRRLSWDLLLQGVGPQMAEQVVGALVTYCQQKRVSPYGMLPGEWSQIHPELKASSLALASAYGDKLAFFSVPSSVKALCLEQFRQLVLKAQRYMAALLILSTLWVGCGVKTQPKSELEDLRPSMPFLEEPIEFLDE